MRAIGLIFVRRVAALVVVSAFFAAAASAQTTNPEPVTVVRQSDSLLNGALIGAGAGVAMALTLCGMMEPWETCTDDYATLTKVGAIGAGIGMAIDALIRKKVYQTASGSVEVHTGALVRPRETGVQLSVRF